MLMVAVVHSDWNNILDEIARLGMELESNNNLFDKANVILVLKLSA